MFTVLVIVACKFQLYGIIYSIKKHKRMVRV